MTATPKITIRKATDADAASIHELVCALARYEDLDEKNLSTVESLEKELAAEDGELEAFLAEADGQAVGMLTFFRTYSTFAARRGIYLEDIFVCPDYRQQGVGDQLMHALGQLAVERGYGRIEWTTLLWNTPAIEFFEAKGASPSDAWTTYRLDGKYLDRLAKGKKGK